MIKSLTLSILASVGLILATGWFKAHASDPVVLGCEQGQGIRYCIDPTVPIMSEIVFEGPYGSETMPYETKSLVVCDRERECMQIKSHEQFGLAPEGMYLIEQGYHLVTLHDDTVVAFKDGYGPLEAVQVSNYNRQFGSTDGISQVSFYDVRCIEDYCMVGGERVGITDLLVKIPVATVTGSTDLYRCAGPLCTLTRDGRAFGLNADYYAEGFQ